MDMAQQEGLQESSHVTRFPGPLHLPGRHYILLHTRGQR